jgi:tetratricopeptide (TPR) repeat protein
MTVARVQANRANALATLDRTHEARKSYERARATFRELKADAVVAQCDYAMAGIDLLEGLLDPCLDRLRRAADRQRSLGDEPGLAHVDLEAADALLRLNRPEEADAAAQSALTWFRRNRQGGEAADALQLRAGAALQAGRAGEAFRLFGQARELHAKARRPVGAALDDVGACAAATAAGKPAEGLALAGRAARALRRIGLRSRRARALSVGAEAARSAGRPARARSLAKEALALARAAKDSRVELAALLVLARLEEDAGRTALAHRRLLAAERCVERLRCGVTAEESRLAFALDKSEVHERLVANRLSVGTPSAVRQALEHAERGKARSLAERVARERLATGGADARARVLVDRIDGIDRDIARAEARLEHQNAPPGVRAPRPSDVKSLLDRRARALGGLAARDPASAILSGAEAPDPWAGVHGMASDEIVLEYVQTGDRMHLLVVEDGAVEAFRDLAGAREIRDRLDLLRFQLGKGGLGAAHEERFGGFVETAIRGHLRALHETLLGPVSARLENRSVRVVPHGPLHGLPFHALEDGEGPLVERAVVSVVPSLAVAGLLAKPRPGRRSAPLVLGVPDAAAPEIEAEVEAVRRHLQGARVFRGERATLDALHLSETRPSVLHVACHGFFGETSPGVAALRLGDAWVSLPDIYGLRNTADLVVLSGCETGRGLVHSGDEWVGLVRGFLQAGARAVVASLWEVHDETAAPLMADFHERLAMGDSAAEALTHAQRAALARGLGVLRWAPFTIVGNPATRPLRRRKAA